MTPRIESMLPLLTTLLPVLYALSAAAYARIYVREESTGARLGPLILRAAVLVHVAYLVSRGLLEGHLPLASVYDFLSATGLSMALVYLYVEAKEGTPNTGIFVVPIIFLIQVVSTAYGLIPPGPKVPFRPFWFELHTLSAVMSYSAFSVSAVYGILFLALYREIKASRFSLFYRRMPSLETLAQMNIRAAGGGLVLLTCAIGLGLGWLHSTGQGTFGDPKIWLTVGVWCIFAFALLAYHRLGWRGPLAIYASLVGFTTLLLSRVLLDLFLHTFHEFR
jgi:ABC-type uncharacterized transport system permease subunit